MKVSLLALSALAGGTLLASAADVGCSYVLNGQFTNNAPKLASVAKLPKVTANEKSVVSGGYGLIATDGAGKIDGVQDIMSDLGGGTNGFFIADVGGSISGNGQSNGACVVTMTIKGDGYADSSAGQAPAKMNLTFKGKTGITVNGSDIETTLPGYNIYLNADGTTNLVERYDPWTDSHGHYQGYTTYEFKWHKWFETDTYTTNILTGEVTANNTIDSKIEPVGLVRWHGDPVTGYFGSSRIRFGTPLNTNIHDQIAVRAYVVDTNGNYYTNIVLNRYLIAEEASTFNRPEGAIYTNVAAQFTTNAPMVGAGDGTNVEDLIVFSSDIVATNFTAGYDYWLSLTPVSTNAVVTTNLSFVPFSPALTPHATNTAAGYYIFDHQVVTYSFDTNGVSTEIIAPDWQFTLNEAYLGSSILATNLDMSVDTNGIATGYVFTNNLVKFQPSFTTNSYVTNEFAVLLGSVGSTSNVVYSNWVGIVDNVYTNWAIATNSPIYGANIADLDAAIAAYQSLLEFNYTNISAYDGSTNYPNYDLLPNQFAFVRSAAVLADLVTKTTAPDFNAKPKATRSESSSWKEITGTLDGAITAGTMKQKYTKVSAKFEGPHMLYTPIASAPGEASYLVQEIPGNLDVITKDSITARVAQMGSKLSLSVDPPEGDYRGKGSLIKKSGKITSAYTANMGGVARAKGSTLSLKGSTRTVVTSLDIIDNAPPATESIVNLAGVPPFNVISATTTTSGTLSTNLAFTATNITGNVTTVISCDLGDVEVFNPVYRTNTVDFAIDFITMNGKVMGQKLVKDSQGVNLDSTTINPLPQPPAGIPDPIQIGWPLAKPMWNWD